MNIPLYYRGLDTYEYIALVSRNTENYRVSYYFIAYCTYRTAHGSIRELYRFKQSTPTEKILILTEVHVYVKHNGLYMVEFFFISRYFTWVKSLLEITVRFLNVTV